MAATAATGSATTTTGAATETAANCAATVPATVSTIAATVATVTATTIEAATISAPTAPISAIDPHTTVGIAIAKTVGVSIRIIAGAISVRIRVAVPVRHADPDTEPHGSVSFGRSDKHHHSCERENRETKFF